MELTIDILERMTLDELLETCDTEPQHVAVPTCEYCDTPVNSPNFAYHFCTGRKTEQAPAPRGTEEAE